MSVCVHFGHCFTDTVSENEGKVVTRRATKTASQGWLLLCIYVCVCVHFGHCFTDAVSENEGKIVSNRGTKTASQGWLLLCIYVCVCVFILAIVLQIQ